MLIECGGEPVENQNTLPVHVLDRFLTRVYN